MAAPPMQTGGSPGGGDCAGEKLSGEHSPAQLPRFPPPAAVRPHLRSCPQSGFGDDHLCWGQIEDMVRRGASGTGEEAGEEAGL